MILGDEALAVDPAQGGHVLAPQAGAVAVDQGFVEIENCQGHEGLFSFQYDRAGAYFFARQGASCEVWWAK